MKRAAVFGGSGFIGTHLCARLVAEGYEVTAYDRKMPEFGWQPATRYHICDLRHRYTFEQQFVAYRFDEVYQIAAEMGGAGYVFTGQNDADIMASSAQININLANIVQTRSPQTRLFYSSSACVYGSIKPEKVSVVDGLTNLDFMSGCREDENVDPDSDYGHEKLFSEHLYDAFNRNYGTTVRIGRFHNIFGTHGTWRGGREKAPAALCRKIAELPPEGGEIEVWGSGNQTRSFLYVSEAVEGILRVMRSTYSLPLNIGSSEAVSINELVRLIADIAGKKVTIRNVSGPVGVDGRNSDNALIEYHTRWKPTQRLVVGLAKTYRWISEEIDKARAES